MNIFFVLFSTIIGSLLPILVFFIIFARLARIVRRETNSAKRQNAVPNRTGVNNYTTSYGQAVRTQQVKRAVPNKQPAPRKRPVPHTATRNKKAESRRLLDGMQLGKSFFNSDFDTYTSYSERQSTAKYVSGYDKDYLRGGANFKNSLKMQYSHTYDGHEPWDDCLPKEKDPWDKNFRS